MECIYYPDLKREEKVIKIADDEYRHLKALRLGIGDGIHVSSGNGITANGEIFEIEKKFYKLHLSNFEEENYPDIEIILALGLLDNRERFEFAMEKAIELGVNRIIPLLCDYSQRNKINILRMQSKAVSAMKQCRRSFLPPVSEPVTISALIDQYSKDYHFILTDMDGKKKLDTVASSIVLVGPEGGFSPEELACLKTLKNISKLKLSDKRLRAETAAIVSVAYINYQLRL